MNNKSIYKLGIIFFLLSFIIDITAQETIDAHPYKIINEVDSLVASNYYIFNSVSEAWKRNIKSSLAKKYSSSKELHDEIESLIKSIDDYSVRYLTSIEFSNLLTEITGEEHTGTGLMELLSVDIDERTRELTVISTLAETSASAELRPGDVIKKIDGNKTLGLTLQDAMSLLRKDENKAINLTVNRSGKDLNIKLLSKKIKAQQNHIVSKIQTKENTLIGYIWIKQFGPNSSQEFNEAINNFSENNVSGIIIDLRNNPGGLLNEAFNIVGMILGKVNIASLLSANNGIPFNSEKDKIINVPFNILINKGSASAAELIAGAVKHYKAGKVIGVNSFGKGLAHNFFNLSDHSVLSIPTGKLFTPSGTDILKEGVKPDIISGNNIYHDFYKTLDKDNVYTTAIKQLLKSISHG